MTRLRLRHVLAALGIVLTACAALAARSIAPEDGLIVHEWGTFTSVAGEGGQAIEWLPLSGPSDLPCFVRTIPQSPKVWYPGGVNGTPATVRMETPVIYFYSENAVDLSVGVRFPQGLITEWFPDATVSPLFGPRYLTETTSTAAWNLKVLPTTKAVFPTEGESSHYYAARATDAAPVKAGGEFEKFLFYRGIASFPVPLEPRVLAGGKIRVENTSQYDFPLVMLFERRGGQFGYRIAAAPRGMTTIEPPALNGSMDALRADLVRLLTDEGLYRREAEAMVETWRDSWFENGTRLFYLLPQRAVDAILPLEIDPKPTAVARVFVGRVEIITPHMEADAAEAFRKGDLASLMKYGRILQPISWRLVARPSAQLDRYRVETLLKQVAATHVPERPCGG